MTSNDTEGEKTMSKLDDLTIGEAKQISQIFGSSKSEDGLNDMIGEKVIIRTYSAGVHFGTLHKKSGNEVILKDSRRMWYWKAKKSISLSGVAVHGIDDDSKICPTVDFLWLEAIEIIPCTKAAIKSIEGAIDVEAI